MVRVEYVRRLNFPADWIDWAVLDDVSGLRFSGRPRFPWTYLAHRDAIVTPWAGEWWSHWWWLLVAGPFFRLLLWAGLWDFPPGGWLRRGHFTAPWRPGHWTRRVRSYGWRDQFWIVVRGYTNR